MTVLTIMIEMNHQDMKKMNIERIVIEKEIKINNDINFNINSKNFGGI